MNREKIAIGILAALVLFLVVFRFGKQLVPIPATADDKSGSVDLSNTPQNTSVTQGPAYLTYNQGPWAFAPPVGNFLPDVVQSGGPGGAVVTGVMDDQNYACISCGEF